MCVRDKRAVEEGAKSEHLCLGLWLLQAGKVGQIMVQGMAGSVHLKFRQAISRAANNQCLIFPLGTANKGNPDKCDLFSSLAS